MSRRLVWPAVALMVGACAYQVSAPVKPAYDVYMSYEEKIPGQFAIYVDDSVLFDRIKVTGLACSAHSYPLDARSAFRQSVVRTISNIVGGAVVFDKPLNRKELEVNGLDGIIIVRADDMNVNIRVIPGFWSAEADAEVEFVAGVIVDGLSGRIFGGTVVGEGAARSDAGAACGGVVDAIAAAAGESMRALMRNLGERVANSERIRLVVAAQQRNAVRRPSTMPDVSWTPASQNESNFSTIPGVAPSTRLELAEQPARMPSPAGRGRGVLHARPAPDAPSSVHPAPGAADSITSAEATGSRTSWSWADGDLEVPKVEPSAPPSAVPAPGAESSPVLPAPVLPAPVGPVSTKASALLGDSAKSEASCDRYRGSVTLYARCRLLTGPEAVDYIPQAGIGAPLEDLMRCHPYRFDSAVYRDCLESGGL